MYTEINPARDGDLIDAIMIITFPNGKVTAIHETGADVYASEDAFRVDDLEYQILGS